MNILVLTSAMIDSHFSTYQGTAKIKPNPSNQNFYSKLIKCLSIKNNVVVVSHRPFCKGMFKDNFLIAEESQSGLTKYYYSRVETGKLYKIFKEKNDILRSAKKAIENFHGADFIVITDTLRYNVLTCALKIGKIYGVNVIGMLTDNPHNLSNVKNTYASRIGMKIKQADGFLGLTSSLVNLYNSDKPFYIFEGLASQELIYKKDPIYDYYFFGGSLYERYGVKALVDAFHQSNVKNKLVIAGNGPLSKYIENISSKDPRILYVGQLSKERLIGYERNSLLNINPRPINKKIDNESVPSKLIEYLSVDVPILSTKYDKIYKLFKDDVFWIENNDVQTIKTAIENFSQSNKDEANKKAAHACQKVFEFYGLDVQCEAITYFLNSLNS